MISAFRKELGDVPFLCGQLADRPRNKIFNAVLQLVGYPGFPIENVDWVSSSELSTMDSVHFDAASTRELGRRYATVMAHYL